LFTKISGLFSKNKKQLEDPTEENKEPQDLPVKEPTLKDHTSDLFNQFISGTT
jgi:hypothetical protein